MTSPHFVDGLDPEVVFTVSEEVFDFVGEHILSRHDGHIGLL